MPNELNDRLKAMLEDEVFMTELRERELIEKRQIIYHNFLDKMIE